jgi:hypothetical protein
MTDYPGHVVEPDDVAGSLIKALAKQGEHVDDGAFTLDPAVALAKLREHQLTDPHGYVLLLVEAAWVAGDSKLGVRIDTAATTTIEFGGVTLEAAALRELFSAVLGGERKLAGEELRRMRVLQLLALAANNALALAPLVITIDARDASGKVWRARIDRKGALVLEPGPAIERGTVRFALHGGGLFELNRATTERNLVVERCRCSTFPIHVDGRRVSHGPGIAVRRGSELPIHLDGREIGLAGHNTNLRASPTHVAINRGVSVPIPEFSGPQGITTVVEVDLPMDLSRQKLLLGPELQAVQLAVLEVVARIDPPRVTELEAAAKPEGNGRIAIGGVILFFGLWLLIQLFELLLELVIAAW